jgi:hypothetical protein
MNGIAVAKWRELYVKYNPMNINKPASIANIAFDTGVIAERERIIKLLENQHNFDQIFLDAVDEVIALIKRENN